MDLVELEMGLGRRRTVGNGLRDRSRRRECCVREFEIV
jgi:hypothetical protein